ncbi:unnamed protein product [Miscanthus lutarioriparius]|uniref:Uncharacterized protein n=1 Tax=Miscanthus lutarioriparius TaxID=422564 RepID=A0A811QS80_9POAL|nr:unnamed protein product [Miscanthus lutarioriparius]
MDETPKSVSSSCNNDDGVPEATGMEKALSDLHALKKLYGLLQRLDETSRALLKKLLDDATCQALLKQANALTTASDSVIRFSLGLTSPRKMDLNNKGTEMEQILSDLEALTKLYSLLHKGPADENLDEASGALLMKILEDATQEAVRRQARRESSPRFCRTRHADPRLRPVASPRPSLLDSERPRRLNLQHSTVSSRSGLHVDGHRHEAEEHPLARLASKHSSRTALPARHRPSQEQRHSSLSLHRFPAAGTSRHGTVTGGTRLTDRRDSIRRSSGRGDQWSPERSSSRSSSRRSVLRELSLGPSSRLHGRATPRYVEAESSSSSSVHLFERMDSGLSLSMTSRHGVEHAERGVATPERSSSSNTMATIQSRIRPSNNLLKEGSLHRSAAEKRRTSRRRQQGSDVSSADMYSSSMSSGSRSSSGAASLSASTSPMASQAPHAFANPYYYYSPPVMTRGIAPPVYAPKVSRSMRRRCRQEILEKRLARLQMLKHKIATVFHHRHDHHHHHHHLGGGQEAGPSSKSVVRGAGHFNTPWQYFTSMFHRAKGKDKNARSRTVVGVPEKRRGGDGNMHALFDAVQRHLKGKRRAPAGMKLRRKASRVRGKKMHWWQRGMAGVTAGSRPRRRLGHGKAGWL